MMLKYSHRIIAFIIAFISIISSFTVLSSVSAANYPCTKTLEELQDMFPHGRYWNHVGLKNWDITTTTSKPCTSSHKHGKCGYSGSCGCNSYKGKAIQCMGFAYALQHLAFNGFDGYSAPENKNYSNAMSKLKPGDVIRYNNKGVNHSIFVTNVSGDTITFMDCNGTGGGCIIRQNQTITKTALKSKFKYVTHAPTELVSNGVNRVYLFETATVTAKKALTIREQPNIKSKKVGSLKSGSIVQVKYYPITDSYGYTWRYLVDESGWVCCSYLKITSGQYMIAGKYRIQSSNGKFVSYVSNPKNDVNIILHENLAGTECAILQEWNFTPLFAFSDSGVIVYRISPALNTAFSLDCESAKKNENLHLWESNNIAAQQWIVAINKDGSVKLFNNASRYALAVKNGNNANFTEIITSKDSNNNSQKFYITTP